MFSRRSLEAAFAFALLGLVTGCAPDDPSVAEARQAMGLEPDDETEPNQALAAATPLASPSAVVRGLLAPAGDVDAYSFQATAGDRVYAATMPAATPGPYTDTYLELRGPDGALIEYDDNDGEIPNDSSVIAGAPLSMSGTHYLVVQHRTGTAEMRPYDLYYALHTPPLTQEIEPNDTQATAQLVTSGTEIFGYAEVAPTSNDYFALMLSPGDTVFYAVDQEPIGFAGFSPTVSVELPSGFTLSEQDFDADDEPGTRTAAATFFTATDPGLHYLNVYLGSSQLVHYRLSVTVFPSEPEPGPCVVFNTVDPLPMPIGPGTAISTILVPLNVPELPNSLAGDVDVTVNLTHPRLPDVDLTIEPPFGAETPLVTDFGLISGTINATFDDSGALVADPGHSNLRGLRFRPEPAARLSWLDDMSASGTWTLRAYDDTPATQNGQLLSWSIRLCPMAAEPTCAGGAAADDVFWAGFEGGTYGFTTRGHDVEWEHGAAASAVITSCAYGAGECFKTNLDGTYGPDSWQDLLSPVIDLTAYAPPIRISWMQKYELEDARFDRAWVELEVLSTGEKRKLWRHDDGTMLMAVGSAPTMRRIPAGWQKHVVSADDLAGEVIRLAFHLDSDHAGGLDGLAVDSVRVQGCKQLTCGNGALDPGEACDDGNATSGDGCDVNCTMTGCGNGIKTAGEECDDGNLTSGDDCSPACQSTLCGDGNTDAGEQCDDGNLIDGDGCDTNCTPTGCGNGVVDPSETCDDGNLTPGDACDPSCDGLIVPVEVEPNDTLAQATPLSGGAERVIAGDLFPGSDADFFAFDAVAGQRAYAAILTFLGDTKLEIFAPDGTLVEGDDNNGVFGQEPALAGVLLPQTGTYHLKYSRVQSGTSGDRYRLILHLRDSSPTPEVEPNDTVQGAMALPRSAHVLGYDPGLNDVDRFAVQLEAGETLVAIFDLTPPEVPLGGLSSQGGITLYTPTGATYNVSDSEVVNNGDRDTEALFYTAELPGRYVLTFGSGSGGGYYRLSTGILPKAARPGICKTYSSTQPGLVPNSGTLTSNIVVPDTYEVGDVDVSIKVAHPATREISATLVAPQGNEVLVFDEPDNYSFSRPGVAATFDDEAAMPIAATDDTNSQQSRYEDVRLRSTSRLAFFDGQISQGTWSLKLRDSEAGEAGTLTGWSLTLCERPLDTTPCPPGTMKHDAIFATFELSDEAFLHNGTGDSWQWGTPNAPPITSCGGGTKCFKTNLSGDYSGPTTSHLGSPFVYNLGGWQPPLFIEWKQKFELGNATQHRAWADIDLDSFDPDPTTPLWRHDSTAMSGSTGGNLFIAESAGWAIHRVRWDGLLNYGFRVLFHLDVSAGGYSGLAIDDFRVTACKPIECGDGYVEGAESCDDDDLDDGDGCDSNCTPTGCGNGILTMGEACDDGNAVNGDGCDAGCKVTGCGNGVVTGVEACDDGNAVNGDGCDANCTVTGCGNGVVTGMEACDDGNVVDGDGCDSNCTPTGCGNGAPGPGEECDDGNVTDGDGCDSNCTMTVCGNGIITLGELCDDGNLTSGDGCDSNCTPSGCGNGVAAGGEGCDDGNAIDGDGCDADCTPTGCGNGTLTPPEICDDGNVVNGDGCDANCAPTGCPNGVTTSGEDCDDGNAIDGDGCDTNCTPTGCGNGVPTAGEECDDGNVMSGDGCSNACAIEGTTGSGGSGGSGAVGGTGGMGGMGGIGGMGGVPGGAGMGGVGAAGGVSGGSGGGSASGGAGDAGGGGSETPPGCGCAIEDRSQRGLALTILGLFLAIRRRRTRKGRS